MARWVLPKCNSSFGMGCCRRPMVLVRAVAAAAAAAPMVVVVVVLASLCCCCPPANQLFHHDSTTAIRLCLLQIYAFLSVALVVTVSTAVPAVATALLSSPHDGGGAVGNVTTVAPQA